MAEAGTISSSPEEFIDEEVTDSNRTSRIRPKHGLVSRLPLGPLGPGRLLALPTRPVTPHEPRRALTALSRRSRRGSTTGAGVPGPGTGRLQRIRRPCGPEHVRAGDAVDLDAGAGDRSAGRARVKKAPGDGATPGGYGGKPPGVAFIGVPTGARNAGCGAPTGDQSTDMNATRKPPRMCQDPITSPSRVSAGNRSRCRSPFPCVMNAPTGR
jgi:hypothetical protein